MFSQNTKDVINDLADGSAFERTMQDRIDNLAQDWSALDQNQIFGSHSPLRGSLDDMLDATLHDSTSIANTIVTDRTGAVINLTQDMKTSLVGTAKGSLRSISSQMESQVNGLTNNLKVFASHQQTLNQLGEGTGCSSMNNTFGTIAQFGKDISNIANVVKTSIDNFKLLKTQLQSEITNFDNNVIAILTGRINGTILSQLVVGSGLHDQIDGILQEAGIAQNSAEAQEIRNDVGDILGPNAELVDFFVTKDLTFQDLKRLKDEAGEIIHQIATEKITIQGALSKLQRVSDGLSMLGMFKSNPCVQTVVGFNGTDSFISKLGSE